MRPRIRTLKPEIWADERVGQLSHGARLLFIGLITMADDEGRLRELPTAMSGHVFPYDNVSTSKLTRWLGEIANAGMVVRYSVGGARYVAFRRWSKHQKVDKANLSELPPPPQTFDESSAKDSTNLLRTIDDDSRPVRGRVPRDRGSDPDPCSTETSQSEKTDDPRELFEYWQKRCGHLKAHRTRERMSKIQARLNEGYTGEQIRKGIDGAALAAFVNERGERFDDIELICRNGSKLESFIARADRSRGAPVVALSRTEQVVASRNRLIDRDLPEGAA